MTNKTRDYQNFLTELAINGEISTSSLQILLHTYPGLIIYLDDKNKLKNKLLEYLTLINNYSFYVINKDKEDNFTLFQYPNELCKIIAEGANGYIFAVKPFTSTINNDIEDIPYEEFDCRKGFVVEEGEDITVILNRFLKCINSIN